MNEPTRGSTSKGVFFVSLLSLSWMLMQIVHESGHVLGAWLIDANIERVVWHPLEFSRTDVTSNRNPLVVAWGGPLAGALIPVLLWLIFFRSQYYQVFRFFAGLCLVANGAYILSGAIVPIGDGLVLRRHGANIFTMAVFGVICAVAGFLFWNGLGKYLGFGPESERPPVIVEHMTVMTNVVVLVIACYWNSL